MIFVTAQTAHGRCIPGAVMIDQRNKAKPAFGMDSQVVYFDTENTFPRSLKLSTRPDFEDSQIYIIANHPSYPLGSAAVIETEWCYETDTQSIVFTRTPPHMRSWGEEIGPALSGSEFWIAYYSSERVDPDCPMGQSLMGLTGDQNGDLIGQDYFEWNHLHEFQLTQNPMQGHGMILRTTLGGTANNIFPTDWCYRRSANKIEFTQYPPRYSDFGGIPGPPIHDYDGIWAAYVPLTEKH
jgi:hypothetical protein